MNVSEESLSGFGRLASEKGLVYRPNHRDETIAAICESRSRTYIGRGMGRSYADSALNGPGGVILSGGLNRTIAFDAGSGIVDCEAGVTLGELACTAIPKRFFLPVTPATQFVSVGGAIAHDVHGKNHIANGSFSKHVLELELLTAQGTVLRCSPNENESLFWATAGGAGLTGFILTARIQLELIDTAYIETYQQKTANIEETLSELDSAVGKYRYLGAWIDSQAQGRRIGRSVLLHGNHLPIKDWPETRGDPLPIQRPVQRHLPFDFPGFLVNPTTARVFNAYRFARFRSPYRDSVHIERYFYPMDNTPNWNRVYGRRGFTLYQVVFPLSAADGVIELVEKISVSRRGAVLGMITRFGEAGSGLLSFPMEGYSVAFDLPYTSELGAFVDECDHVVLRHGGRKYLAKDDRLSTEMFRQMYPKWEAFLTIKQALDPENVWCSNMARRIGLIAPSSTAGRMVTGGRATGKDS